MLFGPSFWSTKLKSDESQRFEKKNKSTVRKLVCRYPASETQISWVCVRYGGGSMRGEGVYLFFLFLVWFFFFSSLWDNCSWWWSLLTLFFDPVVQLLLYFLHGWALLQTCRAVAHFDWFFFSFLRKEIAISQHYGNAAQIYNYQSWETPWAAQAACIWHSWIGLALLEHFSQETQVFPFCDEFVWSLLFVYLLGLLAFAFILFV